MGWDYINQNRSKWKTSLTKRNVLINFTWKRRLRVTSCWCLSLTRRVKMRFSRTLWTTMTPRIVATNASTTTNAYDDLFPLWPLLLLIEQLPIISFWLFSHSLWNKLIMSSFLFIQKSTSNYSFPSPSLIYMWCLDIGMHKNVTRIAWLKDLVLRNTRNMGFQPIIIQLLLWETIS